MKKYSALSVAAFALTAAGLFALHSQKPAVRPAGTPRTAELLSISGTPIGSLFVGIPAKPRALAAALKARAVKPVTCTASTRWLTKVGNMASKLGDLLGLTPQVVHAQSCMDCFIAIQEYDCPGGAPCDDYIFDEEVSGGDDFDGYTVTFDGCGDPQTGCPIGLNEESCMNFEC